MTAIHFRFRRFAPVAALLLVALAALPSPSAMRGDPERMLRVAGAPLGVMAGVVVDARGIPQMGAAVTLIGGDGRILHRVYSSDRGAFLLERVIPGHYSLRVSLASFLPVLKENVAVEPGGRSFLSINLASLFDTVNALQGRRINPPGDDDWTWVLRSAGATRPALRYHGQDEETPRAPRDPETKNAVLQFSGGAGRSTSAGSEADFNTSFTLANSVFHNSSVLLSGNVGYERQTPATAFRGSFRREMANGSTPELSVTLRQVFLPSAFLGRSGAGDERMQSLTLAAGDRLQVAGEVTLEYGVLYDSISFLDRLSSFSPYGRITWDGGGHSSWQIYYTEGAPHERLPGADSLREVASQLSVFPRMSLRDGNTAIQRGRHMEVSYRRNLGAGTAVHAAIYRDDISDLALTSGPGGEAGIPDFMPDVFTNQFTFNSGNHHTGGLRAALNHKLSDRLQATFAYTYGGVLMPERMVLFTGTDDELRAIMKMQNAHALAVKLAADIPVIRTRIYAGYKWIAGPAVTASDIYDDSLGQADPYLNIVIRQPLPSFDMLPGRVEALADFRNLLAQGYVPITTAHKKRLLMVQNARSFRGGFSFVF